MVWKTTLALVLLATSASARGPDKQDRRAAELTVQEASELVTVKGGDELDLQWQFSTEPFNKKRNNDRFLRAYADKKTGDVRFELYLAIASVAKERISHITLQSGDEVVQAKGHQVWFDVSCQRRACTYYRDYVFDVPEQAMIEGSDGAAPDIDNVWKVRAHSSTGESGNIEFLKTEVAALILAIQRALPNEE